MSWSTWAHRDRDNVFHKTGACQAPAYGILGHSALHRACNQAPRACLSMHSTRAEPNQSHPHLPGIGTELLKTLSTVERFLWKAQYCGRMPDDATSLGTDLNCWLLVDVFKGCDFMLCASHVHRCIATRLASMSRSQTMQACFEQTILKGTTLPCVYPSWAQHLVIITASNMYYHII